MISRVTSARGGGEQASAAVEFALVLPLLLILALAIVQVAILVKDELIVVEAARAGARQAAVVSDDDSARQAAVGAATSLDPELLDVTVVRDGGAGSPATVTVAYHAPITVPLVAWLFPQTVDLTASAVMRQETG